MKTEIRYGLTIAAMLAVPAPGRAAAWTKQMLVAFDGSNGGNPQAGLTLDAQGNLYGATYGGGGQRAQAGTVFKLTRPAAGQTEWQLNVVTRFPADGSLGLYPAARLIFDAAGNLYGTTVKGGANGDGTVFRLSPPAAGQGNWTESVLLSFDGHNGAFPHASLIADAKGNFYGMTVSGGAADAGTAFELSPPASGQGPWTATVLASFGGANGAHPHAALLFDEAGNLYGTASTGGAYDKGTVFKLSQAAGQAGWTETVLVSFDTANGRNPYANLIADGEGNFYGTTAHGGNYDNGTVFVVMPPTAHRPKWSEIVLASFDAENGIDPASRLVFDQAGNLYGTTTFGGSSWGTVFKLSPPSAGLSAWSETVIATFDGTNGGWPVAGLIFDRAGRLYGTTSGGASGNGTVFELSP